MTKLPEKKLDVKLIALDLDDTLLGDDKKISDRNVEALRKAAAQGIYIVLCSGRAEHGILPFVHRLEIAGTEAGKYIIAVNGCSVYDMHRRDRIYERAVDAEILLKADEIAERYGFRSEVYSPDTIFFREETEWTRLDAELCGLRTETVADFHSFIKSGSFPKLLVPGDPEILQKVQSELKSEFGSRAVIFTSKPYFLEVLPPDCGKGEAIQWLAGHTGISQDQTICFGDSMNDESMIRKCGYGVAMCNGLDYIKEIASFVTEKSNDESGVGDFVEKYILK